MEGDLELDECDKLILLYLYLVGTARLRDIVKNLKEKCKKLSGRDAFYRKIQRRLIKTGLVEKKHLNNRITYYELTQRGIKKITKGVTTKNQIKILIEEIIRKQGMEKIDKAKMGYVSFDITIRQKGKIKHIKIVKGFTLPKDTKQFLKTLNIIEYSDDKFKQLNKLRNHLEIIVNEKMHVANLINIAQRSPNENYVLIIIVTDPREIPKEIKDKISQIGRYINELLDRALERIETLQKQGQKKPKNSIHKQ